MAHHLAVLLHRVWGQPTTFQKVIDGIAQVLDGIEQGAVQIENNKFLHHLYLIREAIQYG